VPALLFWPGLCLAQTFVSFAKFFVSFGFKNFFSKKLFSVARVVSAVCLVNGGVEEHLGLRASLEEEARGFVVPAGTQAPTPRSGA